MADIIQINSPGPQGSTGPIGPKGDPGQLTSFVDVSITGSLYVSGNILQGNITGSTISASSGFIGDLTGTSSRAVKINTLELDSSIPNVLFPIPFISDGVVFVNRNANFGYEVADQVLKVNNIINNSTINDTQLTGSFTGSFEGTSSFAISSSQTTTASFAVTASHIDNAVSAAFATTASFAITASHVNNAVSASSSTTAGIAEYTSEWILGAEGTNHYTFTGPGFTSATSDPNIYLVRGHKYKFTNNMGVHPFQIQNTSGIGGTAYNSGITNNSVVNGTLIFNVPMDAPEVLYYQCTSHGNMGGPIYISHPISASFATTSSFAETVASDAIFPFTGSAQITGSLGITGSLDVSTDVSASEISASVFRGNGQFLTGITPGGGIPFPFIGDAEVRGNISASQGGEIFASTGSFERLKIPTGTGTPKISSANILILSGAASVQIEDTLRLNPTNTESVSTPQNGAIVYDNSAHKFMGYANGVWVALH